MTKFDKDGNMVITDSEGNEITILTNYKEPVYEKGTLGYDIKESEHMFRSGERVMIARSDISQECVLWLSFRFFVEKQESIQMRKIPKKYFPFVYYFIRIGHLKKKLIKENGKEFVAVHPIIENDLITFRDCLDFVLNLRKLSQPMPYE